MKIFIEDPSEYELKDMLWSGAEDTLDEIIKADKFDNFCAYIDDIYGDEGVGLTQLNDILRFDTDQLKKDIGMFDLEEVLYKDYLKDFQKDCETYKKPRMITDSDMVGYGEESESELSEHIDEITDKLSECLDAIDEVFNTESYDDFESAKDDLESNCDDLDDLINDYVDIDSKVYDALYNKFSNFFIE